MNNLVLFRRPPDRAAPARALAAASRRLACRWVLCPETGALSCLWELAGSDPNGSERAEGAAERPPLPSLIAA